MRKVKLFLIILTFLIAFSCKAQVKQITTDESSYDSVFSKPGIDSLIKEYKSAIAKDSMDWSSTYKLGMLYADEFIYWLTLGRKDSLKGNSKSSFKNNKRAAYFKQQTISYLERTENIASQRGDVDYPYSKDDSLK